MKATKSRTAHFANTLRFGEKTVLQISSIENNDECKKGSCCICYKEFKVPKSEFALTEQEFEELHGEKGMLSHNKCYEFKDMKQEWEEAIDKGTRRRCPQCDVGGVKDDACTHMTCDNCQTQWCYLCGLAVKD